MSQVRTIVATVATLEAEDHGGNALATLLNVEAPSSWPPEHNDADTRAYFRTMIEQSPDEPGFGARYAIAGERLVGTCGFKGPPGERGEVEIGYAIIPAEQGKGYATAAIEDLVAFAFSDRRVTAVLAETLIEGLVSQKVLLASGFQADGTRDDPDEGIIACFRRSRPGYSTR